MRILAISDTHRKPTSMNNALEKLGKYDLLIHLGDGLDDLDYLKTDIDNDNIITVKGNGDFRKAPDFRVLEVDGHKIFCCHGHTYGVREGLDALNAAAKINDCSIALYGHTHVMSDITENNIRMINPGSIGYPYIDFGAVEIISDSSVFNVKFLKV